MLSELDLAQLQEPRSSTIPETDLSALIWHWRELAGSGVAQNVLVDTDSNISVTSSFYPGRDDQPESLIGAHGAATGRWLPTEAVDWLMLSACGPMTNGILADLSQLTVGWNGDGSVPPSKSTQTDISTVAPGIPTARIPDIEVDDDGSVALMWSSSDRIFAMTFLGNGKVVGTLTPFDNSTPPWVIDVDDYTTLRSNLDQPQIAAILA